MKCLDGHNLADDLGVLVRPCVASFDALCVYLLRDFYLRFAVPFTDLQPAVLAPLFWVLRIVQTGETGRTHAPFRSTHLLDCRVGLLDHLRCRVRILDSILDSILVQDVGVARIEGSSVPYGGFDLCVLERHHLASAVDYNTIEPCLD